MFQLNFEAAQDFGGVQLAPSGFFRRDPRAVLIQGAQYLGFPQAHLQCADARLGFVEQVPAPRIQVYGDTGLTTAVAEGNITGTSVDGSTLRLGRVADPDDPSKWCWHFRVHPDDPLTASSKRGEFAYLGSAARAPHRSERIVGLCSRLQDWRSLTDQQLFWQWHSDDALSAAASPWLAGYVLDGELVIQQRYDTRDTPVSQTIVELYRDDSWTPLTWDRWVIRSVTGYSGGGLVQILRNGSLVVDYRGPVGSNEAGVGSESSYFKSGYYHWINAGNDWDLATATRETWHKGAYVADGSISIYDMDSFLSTL